MAKNRRRTEDGWKTKTGRKVAVKRQREMQQLSERPCG